MFHVERVCMLDFLCSRSGIQCYIAFVRGIKGMNVVLFPPKLDWLLVWASMFRCSGTFSNYLGYVKVACLIERADVCVCFQPSCSAESQGFRQQVRTVCIQGEMLDSEESN